MNEVSRDSFQKVREFCNGIAEDNDINIRVNNNRRTGAVSFELIPDGSSYGAQIRLTKDQLADNLYIAHLLQGKEVVVSAIKEIKDNI